ncbi:MAG TPA: hypothetical protein VFX76_04250, partial [Roseiflexaceae bacterium]|nr:hypothetical protein [Roseiflexaceae bacterium]
SDDASGYTVTLTNALGDRSTMRVETLPGGEQRRTEIAPNGATTVTVNKSDGSIVTTDARGNVTTTVFAPDPRWGVQASFVKSTTSATAAGAIFYSFTANRTLSLQDPFDVRSMRSRTESVTINGQTTTTVFDVASRTFTTTSPAGARSVTTLDAKSRVVREETTNLAPREYAYDAQGRVIALLEGTGAEARTTTFSYNAQGLLASTTDALGGATTYTYDDAGRLLTRTQPTGHSSSWSYDAAGNLVSSVDMQGLRTEHEYDAQNRLLATTLDPDGRAIRSEYAYDLAGNLLARLDDAGPGRPNTASRYEYIPMGGDAYAVSKAIDPLGQVTSYEYTADGQLSRIVDPLGHATLMTYSAQGWRNAITTPSGRTTRMTHTPTGQIASVIDPRGGRTTFSYDAAGRLATTIAGAQAIGDQPALNQTIAYSYDVNSRVVGVTDPRGKVATRSYDRFGRLVDQRDPLGNGVALTYDALDRPILRAVGISGAETIETAYSYDALGRLLAECTDPNGLNLCVEYRYHNNEDGDSWNPLAVVDPRGNLTN